MSTRPCPHCQQPRPIHLPHSSAKASVDYFRCATCGYVFAVEKIRPHGPIREVTTNEPPYRDGLGYWQDRA